MNRTAAALWLLSAALLSGCSSGAWTDGDWKEETAAAAAPVETSVWPDMDETMPDGPDTEAETGKNGESTESAEQEKSFAGKELLPEEAGLLLLLEEEAKEEVLLFDCADYDGDGAAEAFAFTGKREPGYLEGKSWFVSPSGARRLQEEERTERIQDKSRIFETEEKVCFWYTQDSGENNAVAYLWGVEDGVPFESVLSGKGSNLSKEANGSFILEQYGMDALCDGTETSRKPCYFYLEGGDFREFGAKALRTEDFYGLGGAQESLASYTKSGYRVKDIWLRGNGIIQLNLTDDYENMNLTCVMKNDRITAVMENGGVTGVLAGDIASDRWMGPKGELQKLWRDKAKENPGFFMAVRPENSLWLDLDGDGVPEEIRCHIPTAEDAAADGVQIEIDGQTAWYTDDRAAEGYRIRAVDLDSSDEKIELLVEGLEEPDSFSMIKLLQYKDGRLREYEDLKTAPVLNGTGSISRIRAQEEGSPYTLDIPGDGTVTLWADTPVAADGLGSYYAELIFSIGSRGLLAFDQKEYRIKAPGAPEEPLLYTARVPIPLYPTAEAVTAGAPLATAAPGEQLYCTAVSPCTKELIFVKLQKKDTGEEGWMLFSDLKFFEETPG